MVPNSQTKPIELGREFVGKGYYQPHGPLLCVITTQPVSRYYFTVPRMIEGCVSQTEVISLAMVNVTS